MAQAKGILPRYEAKEILKDPESCGYFYGLSLDIGLGRDQVEAFLTALSEHVDALVVRDTNGDRVAAVAVGFAPTFFKKADGSPRFEPPLQQPVGFATLPAAPGSAIGSDLMLYVVSTQENRVSAFILAVSSIVGVSGICLDRGFQRSDGTEVFGYADGLRNVPRSERPDVVYVTDKRNFEESSALYGGSYMAYVRIIQHPAAFAAAGDQAARDAIMGRTPSGERLDGVGKGAHPRDEPNTPPAAPMLPSSHVAKVGPRGAHDDILIFRRGLPFVDVGPDGRVEVGLNFCSFQSDLDRFDVVFNDWAMSPHFNPQPGGAAPGIDALLDPARGFTTMEKHGFYFVPPTTTGMIGAAFFAKPGKPGKKPKTGRVMVRKRVVSTSEPGARFERGGFVFEIRDGQGQIVGDTLTTDSTGRAYSGELAMDVTYTLHESSGPPIPNMQAAPDQQFLLDTKRKVVEVVNTVTQPGGGYGGR